MEENIGNLANQVHDIKRLEQYKKDALAMGGMRLYRTIRPDENPDEGLKPRGEGSHSPRAHIAQGGLPSLFISTTTDLQEALKWAEKTLAARVVLIDTEKVSGLDESIIDLNHKDVREEIILNRPDAAFRDGRPIQNKRVERDAINSREVLIKSSVPKEAITLIYSQNPNDIDKIHRERENRWGEFREVGPIAESEIWMKPSDRRFL